MNQSLSPSSSSSSSSAPQNILLHPPAFLPKEIVHIILEFDGRVRCRNGVYINRIDKQDGRIEILNSKRDAVSVYYYEYYYFNHRYDYMSRVVLNDTYEIRLRCSMMQNIGRVNTLCHTFLRRHRHPCEHYLLYSCDIEQQQELIEEQERGGGVDGVDGVDGYGLIGHVVHCDCGYEFCYFGDCESDDEDHGQDDGVEHEYYDSDFESIFAA